MQARYRVIPGQQVAHCGKVYLGGEILELDPAIALEVRSCITPVDAAGKPKSWPTDAAGALAAELAKARPHERISILKAARDAGQAHVADIDREIAAEELRLQGETPAPKGK